MHTCFQFFSEHAHKTCILTHALKEVDNADIPNKGRAVSFAHYRDRITIIVAVFLS